jgi:hypothetical protein
MSEPDIPELDMSELDISEDMVCAGEEVSVMGVPLGAETAGSLMALSGRGRAVAKPERSATAPTKGAMKTIMIE